MDLEFEISLLSNISLDDEPEDYFTEHVENNTRVEHQLVRKYDGANFFKNIQLVKSIQNEKIKAEFVTNTIRTMKNEIDVLFSEVKSKVWIGDCSVEKSWFQDDNGNRRTFLMLAYDRNVHLLFCVYCAVFSSQESNELCHMGLHIKKNNRNKQIITRHENTLYHQRAVNKYQPTDYEKILKKIIEAVLFVTTSGLPLRYNKTDRFANVDLNQEKFFIRGLGESHVYGVLKMMASSDLLLQKYLLQTQEYIRNNPRSKKTTFLTDKFWKKILRVVTKYITDFIAAEIVLNGKKFAIQIDSTIDISRKHQVSVVVKYVIESKEGGFIPIECTVAFKSIESTTAKDFFNFLKETLKNIGLDLKHLTGISTDGAKNMSSINEGLIGYILKESPNVVYQGCASHRLNLAVKAACNNEKISQLFKHLNDFAVIIKNSTKRIEKYREAVLFLHEEYKDIDIRKMPVQIGDTRWLSRHHAINSITSNDTSYVVMYMCLHSINKHKELMPTSKQGIETMQKILQYWSTFENIATAYLVNKILSAFKDTAQYLQNACLHIYEMVNEVSDLYILVSEYLVPETQEKMVMDSIYFAESVINKLNSDDRIDAPCIILQECKDTLSKTLSEFLVTLQTELQIKYIDEFDKDIEFYKGIRNLDPSSFPTLDYDNLSLQKLCARCNLDYQSTVDEFKDFVQCVIVEVENYGEERLVKLLNYLGQDINKKKYPNLVNLYKYVLSLPCTEVRCERDFSQLKHLKNSYRSMTGNELLENEMIILLNKDLISEPNLEQFIHELCSSSQQLKNLLLNQTRK